MLERLDKLRKWSPADQALSKNCDRLSAEINDVLVSQQRSFEELDKSVGVIEDLEATHHGQNLSLSQGSSLDVEIEECLQQPSLVPPNRFNFFYLGYSFINLFYIYFGINYV